MGDASYHTSLADEMRYVMYAWAWALVAGGGLFGGDGREVVRLDGGHSFKCNNNTAKQYTSAFIARNAAFRLLEGGSKMSGLRMGAVTCECPLMALRVRILGKRRWNDICHPPRASVRQSGGGNVP